MRLRKVDKNIESKYQQKVAEAEKRSVELLLMAKRKLEHKQSMDAAKRADRVEKFKAICSVLDGCLNLKITGSKKHVRDCVLKYEDLMVQIISLDRTRMLSLRLEPCGLEFYLGDCHGTAPVFHEQICVPVVTNQPEANINHAKEMLLNFILELNPVIE